jgi:hypothetical protein
MHYDILLFTNMFRSLLQRSSGYHKTRQKIKNFKFADIENCKTAFFYWRLHTAEILQLELTNVPYIIHGTILTVITSECSFHRMSSHWFTLQTDTLESRLLSTCTAWSDRQLAATGSVTKQAQITVGNSTDCSVKHTAGNCILLQNNIASK